MTGTSISAIITCTRCEGSGVEPGPVAAECARCGGSGIDPESYGGCCLEDDCTLGPEDHPAGEHCSERLGVEGAPPDVR